MSSLQHNIQLKKTKSIHTVAQTFVEVVLGQPSAKCKHLGICKIESVHSNGLKNNKDKCPSTNKLFGIASYKQRDYFELVFERRTINQSIFDMHFKSGLFKVEEPYVVELEITNVPILISPGTYNINLSNSLIGVRFPID